MKDDKKFLGLITLGGVVGIVIIGSFVTRGYLDFLRIKRLKQEIKANSGASDVTNLMGNED
tara:strand:- start:7602 stop:7784 length:183 start_codon:yes stop_codon:yes gene_type:complete